jgi:Asp/Glu/hydantoin racemase
MCGPSKAVSRKTCRLRILLINPNTSDSVTALVAKHVETIAGDAASFVPVTGRFGARYISTRASAAIAGHAALDALATHGNGCDAVYLACFGDPGLLALREISNVPVVGMAEASCLEACHRGRSFAIVTGGALWRPMLTEFVASLDLADRLAAVRTIVPTGGEIAANPDAALAQLTSALHCLRHRRRRRGGDPWWRRAGRPRRADPADGAGARAVFRRGRHPSGDRRGNGAVSPQRAAAGAGQHRPRHRPR